VTDRPAAFVSNDTGCDNSTKRRVDPSASVSNPGRITSGELDLRRPIPTPPLDFLWCSVHPKPVAGKTGLADPVAAAESVGAVVAVLSGVWSADVGAVVCAKAAGATTMTARSPPHRASDAIFNNRASCGAAPAHTSILRTGLFGLGVLRRYQQFHCASFEARGRR
jgi:hypothetical protein